MQTQASMEVICSLLLQDSKLQEDEEVDVTMLGFGLYTQALTYERVHTQDTKWKESAFQANKLPRKRATLSYVYNQFLGCLPHKPRL